MHERILTMVCLEVLWIRDILVRIRMRIREAPKHTDLQIRIHNTVSMLTKTSVERAILIRMRIHNTAFMITKPSVERAIFLCLYSGESRRPETAAMWPYSRVSN